MRRLITFIIDMTLIGFAVMPTHLFVMIVRSNLPSGSNGSWQSMEPFDWTGSILFLAALILFEGVGHGCAAAAAVRSAAARSRGVHGISNRICCAAGRPSGNPAAPACCAQYADRGFKYGRSPAGGVRRSYMTKVLTACRAAWLAPRAICAPVILATQAMFTIAPSMIADRLLVRAHRQPSTWCSCRGPKRDHGFWMSQRASADERHQHLITMPLCKKKTNVPVRA